MLSSSLDQVVMVDSFMLQKLITASYSSTLLGHVAVKWKWLTLFNNRRVLLATSSVKDLRGTVTVGVVLDLKLYSIEDWAQSDFP